MRLFHITCNFINNLFLSELIFNASLSVILSVKTTGKLLLAKILSFKFKKKKLKNSRDQETSGFKIIL